MTAPSAPFSPSADHHSLPPGPQELAACQSGESSPHSKPVPPHSKAAVPPAVLPVLPPPATTRAAARWPHAPLHWFHEPGTYMVTASTLDKALLFDTPAKREAACGTLFDVAAEFCWNLLAWSVMANHYHLVLSHTDDATTLPKLLRKLHAVSARDLNRADGVSGRQVWFQYWDTRITHERSLLARLAYVHRNPEHHRLVARAEEYPTCSAAWFARTATPAFRATVESFPIDRVNVPDHY